MKNINIHLEFNFLSLQQINYHNQIMPGVQDVILSLRERVYDEQVEDPMLIRSLESLMASHEISRLSIIFRKETFVINVILFFSIIRQRLNSLTERQTWKPKDFEKVRNNTYQMAFLKIIKLK